MNDPAPDPYAALRASLRTPKPEPLPAFFMEVLQVSKPDENPVRLRHNVKLASREFVGEFTQEIWKNYSAEGEDFEVFEVDEENCFTDEDDALRFLLNKHKENNATC